MQQRMILKILRTQIYLFKLDTDKLRSLPNNLSILKTKVDKLNIDKLVPVPADLGKLSNVVNNEVVKKN